MPNSHSSPQKDASSVGSPPVTLVRHNFKRPDMSWRDHLVMLLLSGAEIEHALMVQYLYAAYSINSDQPTSAQRATVEGWRASILSVAREEMGHLLTVQNVLVLLGAPISLNRQMMPWDHEYYPFPFSLEPFSISSLHCFIYAEMPRPDSFGMAAPGKRRDKVVPSRISVEEQLSITAEITSELGKRFDQQRVAADMHRVGELYDEIIALISNPERIPDSAFNEASYDLQASWDDWGRGYSPALRRLDPEGNRDPEASTGTVAPGPSSGNALSSRDAQVLVERVATRAQAVKALRALAAQGEAPHLMEDETGEPSHFERFVLIYEEFKALKAIDPLWNAARPVPRNPTTRSDFARLNPDHTTYIGINDDELGAHYFAQLFNQRYRLLLSYLAHTFGLARAQAATQPGLRGMVMHRVFAEMYNIKTIAGLLVQLPLRGGGCAGPPFEMPYTIGLPLADRDIWRQYDDLLSSSQHTCREIIRLSKIFPAMNKSIADLGGHVYLSALTDLDGQTRAWIGKLIASGA